MSRAAPRSRPPAALGYRWPAEWEPHAATWLAWPHERSDWPGKFAPIPWVYGEVVRHLVPGERVRILVQDASTERQARAILRRLDVDLDRVDFFRVPTDRSWTRDFCPLFVRRKDGDVARRAGVAESGGCSTRNAVVVSPARNAGWRTSQRRKGRFVVTPSTDVSARAAVNPSSASSRVLPCAISLAIIGS